MLNQDNINNNLTVTSILMYFAIGLHVRFLNATVDVNQKLRRKVFCLLVSLTN